LLRNIDCQIGTKKGVYISISPMVKAQYFNTYVPRALRARGQPWRGMASQRHVFGPDWWMDNRQQWNLW